MLTLGQTAAGDTTELGKFRALLNTGERIEGFSGKLSPDSLTGTTMNGGPVAIPVRSIRALDRSTGSNAGEGALIGGCVGLSTAVMAWMQASTQAASDPYTEVDNSKILPVFAGFTAGGVLVGFIIGSTIKKWKKVPVGSVFGYLPDKREIRFGFNLAL